MDNTIKLYDMDSYQTEFTAAVLSCEAYKNGYALILDRTLFFPEEGGQNADIGTINDAAVIDVQIKNNVITHYVDKEILPGITVNGTINWKQRYSNMQQHSGEHILSGLIHSHFGFDNVGFHLGTQAVTLDFNGILLTDQLEEMESLANEAVYKNIEIAAGYPSEEVLNGLTYRSKIELSSAVRIVTIPGFDTCACCAPHVRRTGEIGVIKIVDAVRYKGGIRISILCGRRALADYRQKQKQVTAISILTSAKPLLVSDAVSRLKDENYSLNGQLIALEEMLIEYKASSVKVKENGNICVFEDKLTPSAHRKLTNLLLEKCNGICAVFVGNDTLGYRYIAASKTEDVRKINSALINKFNARGGGCKEMVQGSLTASVNELSAII